MHWNIIGRGRIGLALMEMTQGNGSLFGRGDSLDQLEEGPIILCVRNDDLADIIPNITIDRRKDCIFVQNGMLQSWLKEHGLEHCTQSLLYFAVAKKGDVPVDGGRTVIMGRWASEFQQLLSFGNIQSQAVSKEVFEQSMCEKYLWICVMSALGDYYQCTVGEILQDHSESIEKLTTELCTVISKHTGILLPDDLHLELNAYTKTIPHYRCSIKEWKWRNGWLWKREESYHHKIFLGEKYEVRLK